MLKIRRVSRDTCQGCISPVCAAFSSNECGWSDSDPQTAAERAARLWVQAWPFRSYPLPYVETGIGQILVFQETSETLCCVWPGRGCVCCVHSTSETSAEGLQLTLLLTLRTDVFEGGSAAMDMESCSQHGYGS